MRPCRWLKWAAPALCLVPLVSACAERDGEPQVSTDTAERTVSPERVTEDTGRFGGDTTTAGRYFVRLKSGADPEEVATRHGVEPLKIITEPARAFYAELSRAQLEKLRKDTLVVSLALETHGSTDTLRPRERGIDVRGRPDTAKRR